MWNVVDSRTSLDPCRPDLLHPFILRRLVIMALSLADHLVGHGDCVNVHAPSTFQVPKLYSSHPTDPIATLVWDVK